MLDKKTMLYLRVEHEPKCSLSPEVRGKCLVIQSLLDYIEKQCADQIMNMGELNENKEAYKKS